MSSVADPGRYSTDPDPDPGDVKKRIRILVNMIILHTYNEKKGFSLLYFKKITKNAERMPISEALALRMSRLLNTSYLSLFL